MVASTSRAEGKPESKALISSVGEMGQRGEAEVPAGEKGQIPGSQYLDGFLMSSTAVNVSYEYTYFW